MQLPEIVWRAENPNRKYIEFFMWFSSNFASTIRYKNLREMETGNKYEITMYYLSKQPRIFDCTSIENYLYFLKQKTGKEWTYDNNGLHSIIYRVHTDNKTRDIIEQVMALKKEGFNGILENGVEKGTVDLVLFRKNYELFLQKL